jgi:hypothetical protein
VGQIASLGCSTACPAGCSAAVHIDELVEKIMDFSPAPSENAGLAMDSARGLGHLRSMTATELRDLIVRRLMRENGGGTSRWRNVIGELRVYSRATHAHCNWDARPTGVSRDVALVERAVDQVRSQHPFVAD